VWEAVSDYKEFSKWFGMEFESPFEPNARLNGRVTHVAAAKWQSATD